LNRIISIKQKIYDIYQTENDEKLHLNVEYETNNTRKIQKIKEIMIELSKEESLFLRY